MQLIVFASRFTTLLTMKLLILLTVIACLQSSAKGFGQTVTLSLNNAPLERAFEELKRQTGYSFVYTRSQLKNALPVNCQIKNAELKEALDLCFRNQPLSFVIEDRYIVVQTKTAVAQTSTTEVIPIDITGRIINENGEPVIGATITAKNSNKATSTNERGEFSLNGIKEEDILVITSVGYYKEEVEVNNQKYFLVRLRIAVSSLDETVIIAYGTTTKRLNTGSVSKVSEEDISRQPVSNLLAALQGRVAGLTIVQGGGLPGSNFSVLIRGKNSIQNGTSPLYIIDGVPFLSDADRLTQLSQVNANSPFNTLNPADIQSIEVLKDADATAIYGSRGANGVILITTKKGVSGKTSVDFSIYRGWGKSMHGVDYMNTQQYIRMRKEAFANDGATPTNSNAADLLLWDTTRYTDWKKLLIGGTAKTTNTQLRFSGGSKGTMFSLSSNYYKETTVFPGDANLSRKTVGFTINHHSPDNRFTLSFQGSYGSNNSKLYQQDLTQFINAIPNAPNPYDSLGRLNWKDRGASFSNPLANILRTYDVTTNRLTANSVLAYRVGKVRFKTSVGYNTVAADEKSSFPIASQNPSFNPKGSANFANSDTKGWLIEPQIEFTTTFGNKGSVQSLIGSTWQENVTNSKQVRASGYTNDFLLNSTTGAALITGNAITDLYYRYLSIYGRSTFNWDRKYLLNLTYRRDGSSRFGPDRQFANFGAVGAGWVFTEEKWASKKLSLLSFGKLRSSYGITGNDQIGDYQYLDTWSGTTFPYGGIAGLYPTLITNPDYSWEQKKNVEIALDLGLFKNRLLVTLNWFRSRSDNQIIRYTLPDQTGSNNILQNFPGIVQNKGWEVEASGTILSNSFHWKSSFNITIPKNKLISFPGLESSSYANDYVEGQPLSILKGYKFLGVDSQTGVYKYEDTNRDGLLNYLDYITIGTADPKYYGGLQNTLSWKGVEFQFFFQFTKQDGREIVYSNSQRPGQQFNQPDLLFNHWTKPGETVSYQKYTQSAINPAFAAGGLISSSSAILTNASFIRLKNLSLSYQLPQNWLHKARLETGRIYVEGQNLYTITKYKGSDPESQSRLSLPPLRLIAIGIQLTL